MTVYIVIAHLLLLRRFFAVAAHPICLEVTGLLWLWYAVSLQATYAKFQPCSEDFLTITNPKAVYASTLFTWPY